MNKAYEADKAFWRWRGIADAQAELGRLGMIDAMKALQPLYDEVCAASQATAKEYAEAVGVRA